MIIREIEEDDWPQVYAFFSRIVADGQTYAYPDDLSSDQARTLWVPGPPTRTVVAVDGSTVLGSATMGPNRPGRGAHIATGSFMVNPERQGRGTGRALGEHVVAWAREAGFRGIQFNAVVETNTGAVALWRSLGFEVLTTVPGTFLHREHGYVGLHVMFLPLV